MTNKICKYNKTFFLTKAHCFHTIVSPKKNHKSPWFYDKQGYKQCNNIEPYFLRQKRFRKFFVRYNELDFILISITLSFIFKLLFM